MKADFVDRLLLNQLVVAGYQEVKLCYYSQENHGNKRESLLFTEGYQQLYSC